jgi:hypothetical protein
MSDYSAPGDLRVLMDKDITLHSFYQVRPEYDSKIPAILREAPTLIAAGKLLCSGGGDLPAVRNQGCGRPRRTGRQGAFGRTEGLMPKRINTSIQLTGVRLNGGWSC